MDALRLGNKRLRLSDDQRRRLAVRGKAIGRRALSEVASVVTPDTILWWKQFLSSHWDVPAAADFFTVEVWGLRGLVTLDKPVTRAP